MDNIKVTRAWDHEKIPGVVLAEVTELEGKTKKLGWFRIPKEMME